MSLFRRKKKKNEPETVPAEQSAVTVEQEDPASETEDASEDGYAEIEVTVLPPDAALDEDRLVEINDPKILKRIEGFLSIAKTVVPKIVEKIETNKNGEICRVKYPSGEKVQVKGKPGKYRGITFRVDENGKKMGYNGHAEITPVEQKNAVKVASSVMNLASVVVQQYYLSEINNKLGAVKEGVAAIAGFQDNEYRSSIEMLFYAVQKIIDYKDEMLGNDELRGKTLRKLADYEDECSKLLGQASNALESIAKKIPTDYAEYESAMREAGKWRAYQSTLLQILRSASELQFALSFGQTSNGLCYATFNRCLDRSAATQGLLPEWHRNAAERLEIDLEANRRKRYGTDQMLHLIPGLFKKDQNYCSLDERVAETIKEQSGEPCLLAAPEEKNLFEQDVQLIFRDGKVYYYAEDGSADEQEKQ